MMGRALAILLCLAGCEIHVAERGDDVPSGLDPECGNGVVEGSEVCDDGNTAEADGCSAACASDETCGNGVIDATTDETCDDGNLLGGDGCSNDCKSDETCGNGVVDLAKGETCDDGDLQGGDGCSANCQSNEACGNAITDINEECDDGVAGSANCDVNCTNAVCGDGTVNGLRGEQCEDGNGNPNDACVNCRVAFCGDGFVRAGVEQCDGGAGCTNCKFDPRSFTIDASLLINQGTSCDGIGEDTYDECTAQPYGFQWNDASPFQPSAIQITFNRGIDCYPLYYGVDQYTTTGRLNGQPSTLTMNADASSCNCVPSEALHTITISGTGYNANGNNQFLFDGVLDPTAATGICSGLSPDPNLGGFAIITTFP